MAFDPSRLRGCLLDMGSVIVDTRAAWRRWAVLAHRALHERGRPRSPAEVRRALRQSQREGASRIGMRALALLSAPADLARQLWAEANPWGDNLYAPTWDAHPALERLSRRFPLVLVSNTEPPARRWLEENGFPRYFRAMLLSAEVGISKPDEGIFRMALDILGCRPEEAVMIGDRLDQDIDPARRLGLATIRVRRGPFCWQRPLHPDQRPHLTVPSLHAAALRLERGPRPEFPKIRAPEY